MKIVTVIPLKKGIFRENLTYFSAKDLAPYSIVTVPFRNKKILGLVVDVEEASNTKMDIKDMNFNLKKIFDIKDRSIFLKEYLDATIDISKYFVTSKNNTVTSLLPAIFREKYDLLVKHITTKDEVILSEKNKIKAEKLVLQTSLEERTSSYKTLIRESFALKKSIFIVLPTESDAKEFYKILSRGIEQFSFIFYSKLNPKKTSESFKKVVTEEHPILVVGTAPFLSIPRDDIGTIIIEKESSPIYKMIGSSHLDLRTFVEVFASKINAKLILSDTLLSFETISRKETGELTPMQNLSFRTNSSVEIEVTAKSKPVNIAQSEEKKFKIISDQSIAEIKQTLEKNKNVFVFSLRKGLATTTVCRDCAEMVACDTCHSPVVLYISRDGDKRIFSCNRCKKALDPDTKCTKCGSWNLLPLGIGTDTVHEELKNIFPKVKILKLDKESAKDTKGAEKIIEDFENNEGAILVGTEMAIFYIKNEVQTSIIASFDSLWSIPNYKMSEKIIQIMISIISKTKNKLIIETKNEDDEAILSLKNDSLLTFIRKELLDRKKLEYPPFKRFIKITYMGNREDTANVKEKLKEVFKEYNPDIFSGFVAKLKDKYVTNMLIKINPENWSLPEIILNSKINKDLHRKLSALPSDFSVVVDPEDLL